jgi:hypothetical protein
VSMRLAVANDAEADDFASAGDAEKRSSSGDEAPAAGAAARAAAGSVELCPARRRVGKQEFKRICKCFHSCQTRAHGLGHQCCMLGCTLLAQQQVHTSADAH